MISTITAGSQLAQISLIDAAKKAGVKRFIPCGFITVAPAGGVMKLRDDVCLLNISDGSILTISKRKK